MFREILSHTDLGVAPLVALCLFVATFIGVVAWSYGKRRTTHFDHMGQLPLDDGEAREQNGGRA